jgi:hypothetical protein
MAMLYKIGMLMRLWAIVAVVFFIIPMLVREIVKAAK